MSIEVKIKDIVEGLEMHSEEWRLFLSTKTGEIVIVSEDDLIAAEDEEPFDHLFDWELENRKIAIDVVENSANHIELPSKDDIDEYQIMEDFCLTVSDQRKQDSLLRAIRGKGAFRRFKDKIINYEFQDQWYSYRDDRFRLFAIEWCKDNGIGYIE